MTIKLTSEDEKLIQDRVQSGQYPSAEALVSAAIARLIQDEQLFAPGELDALIAEGEADFERGDTIDGQAAFNQIREKSARYRAERRQ